MNRKYIGLLPRHLAGLIKLLVFTLFILGGGRAFAQQGATVELTGRVTGSRQPLDRVSVTLSSEALQGSRVILTGENGGFFVPFLPAGSYELLFERQGFVPLRKSVRLALGETARVEVELQIAAITETLTVDSSEGRIPVDNAIGTNFRHAEIDLLPVNHDIPSIVLLSPSASGGRSLMIAGAPSWDSLFLVHGVVVNEYQTGQPHSIVFEDAIEEVAVLSGAISAEYGRFTGGVVSTITKSGRYQFHGSLRDRMTNDAWQTRTPWAGEPSPLNVTNDALEGTLGGFVWRDRLWFFVAARDARSSTRRYTTLTDVAYRSDKHDQRAEAKLTARLSPRHSLIGSFVTSSIAETNVASSRTVGRALDLETLIPERRQPLGFLALTSTSVFPAEWFTEIRYSTRRGAARERRPVNRQILGTLLALRGTNATANAPFGCGICGDDDATAAPGPPRLRTIATPGSGTTRSCWSRRISRDPPEPGHAFLERLHGPDGIGANRAAGKHFPCLAAGTQIFWTPYFVGERASISGPRAFFER